MRVLAIGGANLRRMIRERSNIFFVFIFPIALILLIGVQFGGDVDPAVGLYSPDETELGEEIAAALDANGAVEVRRFDTEEAVVGAVERGTVQAGVFLPARLDQLAAGRERIEIGFVARPDGLGSQLQTVVGATVAQVMGPVGAARYAAVETGLSFDQALDAARRIGEEGTGLTIELTSVGEALFPETLGRFDLGASQQLVLFVFLTALAGSSALILTRQLGISRRMLSTPTSLGTIVVGESMGRFGVAMVQGVYIMVLTFLIFGVNWGDPVGAFLLLVTFAAVGAGAGMLMGAVLGNEQQAGGIGVLVSLGLAALGGSMLPMELFSPTLRRVAHLTPHAWALDGFAELVRRGGTTGDILTELGVLALYAAVLLALASWRLRLALTRA